MLKEATKHSARNMALFIDQSILDNIYKEAKYEVDDSRNISSNSRIGMLYGYKLFSTKFFNPASQGAIAGLGCHST
jgi:hypothetical protein